MLTLLFFAIFISYDISKYNSVAAGIITGKNCRGARGCDNRALRLAIDPPQSQCHLPGRSMRWRRQAMNWFWQFCCASTATVLLMAGAPQQASAAPPPPAALAPQDSAELQKIAAYLDGIHTMTAHFAQQTASGGGATGEVWMQRPGKMRFQYDPPNELLLLADAFYLYSWDPDLKQMSKVGLKSTPAWFLLREPISFTEGVTVTRFEHSGNTVKVTVVETAEPD